MKRAIYDFFSNEIDSNGDYYNIGTFEQFDEDMQDPQARRDFYDFFSNEVDENGDYYNLGTFAEFEQDIARSTAKEIGKASAQATGQATKEQPKVAHPVTAVQASDRANPFYTEEAYREWLAQQPKSATKQANQELTSGQVTETPTAPSAPKAEDITTTKATAATAEAPKVETTANPVSALHKADGTPYKAEELQAMADKQQAESTAQVAEQPTVQVESVEESQVGPTETDQAKLETKVTKAEGDQKAEDGESDFVSTLQGLYGKKDSTPSELKTYTVNYQLPIDLPTNLDSEYYSRYGEDASRVIFSYAKAKAVEDNGGNPLSDMQLIDLNNRLSRMSEDDVAKLIGEEGMNKLMNLAEKYKSASRGDAVTYGAVDKLFAMPGMSEQISNILLYPGGSGENEAIVKELLKGDVTASTLASQNDYQGLANYINAKVLGVEQYFGKGAVDYYMQNPDTNKDAKSKAILNYANAIKQAIGKANLPQSAEGYLVRNAQDMAKRGQIGTTDGDARMNDMLSHLAEYGELMGMLSDEDKAIVLERANKMKSPYDQIKSIEDACFGGYDLNWNIVKDAIVTLKQQQGVIQSMDDNIAKVEKVREDADGIGEYVLDKAVRAVTGPAYYIVGDVIKDGVHAWTNPDLAFANYAMEYYKDAKDILEDGKDSGFVGFMKGLGNSIATPRVWDFGARDLQMALAIKAISEKWERNEELTEAETMFMDAVATNIAAQALTKQSTAYQVGSNVGGSIPYLIEMALPVKGGKTIASKVYKWAVNRVERGALKNIIKYASKLTGGITEAGIRTATIGVGRVAEGATKRLTPEINLKQNEKGGVAFDGFEAKPDKSVARAIGESAYEKMVEYWVEKAGRDIFKALGVGKARKLANDFLKRKGIEIPKNTDWNAALKAMAYNGSLEEFGEEMLTAILQTPVNETTLDANEKTGVFNADNITMTALTTYTMSALLNAPNVASRNAQQKKFEQQLSIMSDALDGELGESWNDWKSAIDNATYSEVATIMDDIRKDKNLAGNQKELMLRYAVNKNAQRELMSVAESESIKDKTRPSINAQKRIEEAERKGANITDVNEGYNTQIREDITGESLARMVGVESISEAKDVIAQRYGTDSPMEIAIEVANDASLNDKQRKVILDYYTALATNQGKQTALEQKRDINKQTADAVSAKTNKDMGKQVVTATRKVDGAQVTIIAGNIVTNKDGSINKEKSDDAIVSVDADGNKEMISLGNISNIATQSKEDAELEERAKLTQELEKAENVSNGRVSVGDVIDYGFYDGNTNAKSRKVVVTDVTTDADGNRMVTFVEQELNGAEPVTMTEKELEVGRGIAYFANNSYQLYNGPVGLPSATAQATQAETTQEQSTFKGDAPTETEQAVESTALQQEQAPTTQVAEQAPQVESAEVVEESTEQPTAIEPGAMVSLADGSIGEVVSMPEDGRVIVMGEDGVASEYDVSDLKVTEKPSAQTSQAPQAPTAPQVELTPAVEQTTESAQQVESTATPTAQVEIPTDENGKKVYEQAPVEATINDIYNDPELDEEEADAYVQAKIDGATKRIEAIDKKKPKMGEDRNAYVAERDAWRAERGAEQASLDYWQGVQAQRAQGKANTPKSSLRTNEPTGATPSANVSSAPSPKMDTPKAEPTAPPMGSKPKAKPIKVGTKRNAKGQVIGLIDSPVAQVLNNTTRRILNKLGESLGVSIHIVPHLEGANAKIEGNRITIAIDAEQGPLKALGHELLHRIKSLSPKAYEDFADVVEKVVPSFQARMVATRLVYSNAGRKIDMKLLREEVVADLAGDVMYHAGLMQKFVEVLRPKTTKEIIMDTMRDLYARIRGVFEGEGARNFAKAERVLLDAMKKANKVVAQDETTEADSASEKLSIIGESGASALDRAEEATIRMDNLAKARKMERFDYPTKSIRMATGWERGADGKWRYEIDDVKLKKTTYENTETTLGELVDNAELFSAYPSLMDLKVVFTDTPNNTLGRTYSQYAEDENGQGAWIPTQISLNNLLVWDDAETESVLAHEIQHAIQSIEGFVNGGDSANKENYHRLAGEVEARNVQSRIGMTPEQRRATLLAETEDVARKDQIFLVENSGVSAMAEDANESVVDINEQEGQALFSLRSYNEGGRDAVQDFVNKQVDKGALTQEQANEIVTELEDIYNICEQYKDEYAPFGAWSDAKVVTDERGVPVFSVIKKNGDYGMNLDFSLVCKKRRTLDAVFQEMINRGVISNFELGQVDIARINDIIREHGFETACRLCFVDSKRFRTPKVADDFANLYNELVEMSDAQLKKVIKGEAKNTVRKKTANHLLKHPEDRIKVGRDNFITAQGFEQMQVERPEILKLYNQAKGSGGPKASFGDTQYMNDIQNTNWTPEKAYAVGGVRLQSFSDYVPRMVFDYVQLIADLASKGLPVHAYTKEPIFAKQFGLTGVKINLSLVPRVDADGVAPGLDKDGNYAWQDGESFPYDEAVALQNAEGYKENVGTIAVGVSDAHIAKMLDDPNIRMVIPYHKSGLNKQVAIKNNIDAFNDYTTSQNTRKADGTKVDKKGLKGQPDFNQDIHNGMHPRDAAQKYLDWCDKKGYLPKFDQFRDHPNYYKLLEDFTTIIEVNGVEQVTPQGAVKMQFPTENDAFGSMESLVKEGLEEDAILEGNRQSKVGDIVDEIEDALADTKYSLRSNSQEVANIVAKAKADGTYMKAPNGKPTNLTEEQWANVRTKAFKDWFGDWENDPENASKVVDENGEPKVVYHQTNRTIYRNVETGENWDDLDWRERQEWEERDDWDEYWEEEDFYAFNRKNARTTNEFDGFFFAPKYDEYHEYGDRTIEVFLNIRKPASREDYHIDAQYNDAGQKERIRLQEEGYDGVIREGDGVVDEYVAFEPNQIKSATDNVGTYSSEDNDTRYSLRSNSPFYSNAEYAVENIKQGKATPEQWLAMIQKNGGLKAGEDKWLGLSDWLNEKGKRKDERGKSVTLTKEEVLEFIKANQIVVEEVEYIGADKAPSDLSPLEAMIDTRGFEFTDAFRHAFGFEYDDYFGIFAYINDEEVAVELYNKDNGTNLKLDKDGDIANEDYETITKWASSIMDEAENYVAPKVNIIEDTRFKYTTEGLDNKREIALVVPTVDPYNQNDEIHFGDAGGGRAVAWVRFGETTDEDGNRVLVIDEIQSKRHQDGREKGYRNAKKAQEIENSNITFNETREAYNNFLDELKAKYGYTDMETLEAQLSTEEFSKLDDLRHKLDILTSSSTRVPDAPFDKNWQELAMKRMLRYAAENGFDKVAWTTGAQQAERYGMSNVVEGIDVAPYKAPGAEDVLWFDIKINAGVSSVDMSVSTDGNIINGGGRGMNLSGEKLSNVVGKELADKILSSKDDITLQGDNLRLGGEGMKGFYDKMLPSFMNKYGKKWGVKVGEVTMPELQDGYQTMHSVDVTDAMRESVMEGQPLFSLRGNTGYTEREDGTPLSNRAYRAESEGVFHEPRFRSVYGVSKLAFQVLEMIGAIENVEWHHVGKNFKQADFYAWEDSSRNGGEYDYEGGIAQEGSLADRYTANKKAIDKLAKEFVARDWEHLNRVKEPQIPSLEEWTYAQFEKEDADQYLSAEDLAERKSRHDDISNSDEESSARRYYMHTDVDKEYADKAYANFKETYADKLAQDYQTQYNEKIAELKEKQRINEQIAEYNKQTNGKEKVLKDIAELLGIDADFNIGLEVRKHWSGKERAEKESRIAEMKKNHEKEISKMEEALQKWVNNKRAEGKILYRTRISTKPEFFEIEKEEMYGRYGWFDATPRYSLPISFSGLQFENKRLFDSYQKRKQDIRRKQAEHRLEYQSIYNDNSIEEEILEQLKATDGEGVKYSLVSDPKLIAELDASPKRIGYRNVLHPDSDGTREEYDKRVKTTSKKFEKSAMTFYNFMEAFVDEMRSLDILQRIVEEKYGIKLPSFENALDAENRSSSMALKEFEAFMDGEYDAMMQFVDRWIKSGETTQSINYYMIAKSGLERNREFTVRDAINELLNHEDESKRITKAQAEQMRKNYADERNALLAELKSGNIDYVTFNKLADKLARKYAFGHKIEDYSGLTGITGDENNFRQIAEDMVLEFEAKHGDAVVDFWSAVKDVTKAPVRKSYGSGLLSKSMYDKLTTMFEWYIPMRGFEEQTAEDVYSYIGADTGVFNPTVALAKGHTEVSDDPLAIMGNMMQSAILQGNRNVVKQRLLFMVRNHPVDVLTESRVWLVLHPDGTWVSSYPELSNDMSADQVAQAIAEHEAKMEKLAKDKKAKISNVNLDIDFKIEKASNISAHAIDVMLNGNHYVIYVNGNPRVAQAVNGQLKDKGTNWLYEVWQSYARWYTASKTSLDVNFMFPNVGRDIQHSTLMTIMDKGFIQGLKFFFNGFTTILPVIKGVSGARIKDPKMRKYWEEFVKYGGETGYAHLESVDDFKRKNEKRLKRMKGVKKATTIAKGTFKYIGSAFDYANRIAESSTRFNAYVSSRKSGADIYDAIRYAKDITVNFNRKGSSMTPGIFGAVANAYRIWMPFANPIIQGIYQFLKVGRRNKGRFFTICGVQMALGFVIPMVNEILFEAIGGDDEDKYINQPDYARRTNMMFYIGGKYIKIPLPPMFRELYGLGDIAYSTMKGLYNPKEATMETVNQIRSMFSLQGQSSMKGKEYSIYRFILPGHLAWVADIAENTTFTGQPLYKEGDFIDEQTPEYQKVYNGTWRYLVEWSRELNHFLGGTDDKAAEMPLDMPSRWMNPAVWQHVISEFGGGPYKFVMDMADLVSPESNDEGEPAEFTWSKVPVAKRFVAEVGDRAETRLLNKQYYDYIDSFDDIEYEEKVYTKKAKMGSMEYAEKLNELILSPEYREYKVKNGYEKAVKDLNKYLNDPGLDKSDRKQVEDAIERFKREVLTEAPKAKNFPTDGASEKVKEKLDSIKDVVEDVIGDGNEQTKERNRVIRDAKSDLKPLNMEVWKEEQKDKVK